MNRALECLKINIRILNDLIDVYTRSADGLKAKIDELEKDILKADMHEYRKRDAEIGILWRHLANDRGAIRAYAHARQIMISQVKEVENAEGDKIDQICN